MTWIITIVMSITWLTMKDFQNIKYTPTVVEDTTCGIVCLVNKLIE